MQDSELILSPRGTIYHLDLHPEQLAPTIFTVGDPARVAQVSRHFDRMEYKASHREFITHTGYIGAKRISVISSGIGPDNIDIVVNELDALVNIDFGTRKIREQKTTLDIIRLGTSGALQEDIPLDTTFVSAQAIGLDNLLYFYQHNESAFEQEFLDDFRRYCGLHPKVRPYLAAPDPSLLRKVSSLAAGTTLTCPGFYGPQGRVLRAGLAQPNMIALFQSFRGPGWRLDNFEMESSALYALGEILGHRCLSISAIIANRATGEFSADSKEAVDQMIENVFEILLKD